MTIEAGLIVSRFVHYASLMLLFGASLFPLYAFPDITTLAMAEPLIDKTGRLLRVSVTLALVSLVGWFLFTVASMANDAQAMFDPAILRSVFQSMEFGKLWAVRFAVLVALTLFLCRRPASQRAWLCPGLAALALASLARTGHAETPTGPHSLWHTTADAVHLLAAGAWLGALWPIGYLSGEKSPALTPLAIGKVLTRFSWIGEAAVAALLLTGVVNSWFLVGSLSRLFGTTYGLTLLFKLGLLGLMLGLAAGNRLWITPRLANGAPIGNPALWLRRLRRHVVAEQFLGAGIIGVVSILGLLDPSA